jgi:hypothetical protein
MPDHLLPTPQIGVPPEEFRIDLSKIAQIIMQTLRSEVLFGGSVYFGPVAGVQNEAFVQTGQSFQSEVKIVDGIRRQTDAFASRQVGDPMRTAQEMKGTGGFANHGE